MDFNDSPEEAAWRAECDAWTEGGVQYVVCAPWRTDLDDWLRSMEQLAAIVGLAPR